MATPALSGKQRNVRLYVDDSERVDEVAREHPLVKETDVIRVALRIGLKNMDSITVFRFLSSFTEPDGKEFDLVP